MSYPAGSPGGGVPAARDPYRQRSATEIRNDLVRHREDLSHSVDALRGRVAELTDWRRQVREHRGELMVGAAIAGFAIGGLLALRRRR